MTVTMSGTSGTSQPVDVVRRPLETCRCLITCENCVLRVLKSALAIIIGTAIGWIHYQQIFDFLAQPINEVVEQARTGTRRHPDDY